MVILAQHANQGKLTGAETALARWLVYVHTHCDLPLDYRCGQGGVGLRLRDTVIFIHMHSG